MKKGVQSVLFSVLVGALLLCAGCGKSGDIYTAGVYTASAEGYSGPVTVEVEFDGSSILSVHVLSHSETVKISDRAIDEIPSQIVEAQTWDVDAVSSATFTSDAIREAVRDCLAQAALRSHSETVKISDRAIDEIPSQIVEAQTWDVDAVSSATFTSDAIREAVRDCLAQAALR